MLIAVRLTHKILRCAQDDEGYYVLDLCKRSIIAAFDPLRHWPIVFVGFLGKVLGPIGMANTLWQGKLPAAAGFVCLTNDLIWWVPFGIILWRAYQAAHEEVEQLQ